MKKWILAAAAALLAWNIWLSITIYQRIPADENGTMIVENTVNGYTTEITDAVQSVKQSLVTVTADDKEISGIIYAVQDENAYIFTDAIITNASPSITFDSGLTTASTLIGTDADTSLTLLKVNVDFQLTPVSHGDSTLLNAGEYVAAVGSRRLSTGSSMVTYGVVSGEEERRMTSASMYGARMIETDALISGENIGGALINAAGELEGMGVSHVVGGQDGMSYAVSISEMKNVYAELTADGSITRGASGITVRSMNKMASYEKAQLGIDLSQSDGVIVESIYVDSPARDILQKGDILLTCNDEEIADSDSFHNMMYEFNSGDTVGFHILRDDSETDVNMVLG